MLSTDLETPVVAETTMATHLLQDFQIFTDLSIPMIGDFLRGLTVTDIALSVQEPGGDLVVQGVLHHFHHAVDFFGAQFTSTRVQKQLVGVYFKDDKQFKLRE